VSTGWFLSCCSRGIKKFLRHGKNELIREVFIENRNTAETSPKRQLPETSETKKLASGPRRKAAD
jgi:hypothetical protein